MLNQMPLKNKLLLPNNSYQTDKLINMALNKKYLPIYYIYVKKNIFQNIKIIYFKLQAENDSYEEATR